MTDASYLFLRTTYIRGPRGPETQAAAKKMKNIQEPETVDEIDSTRSIRNQFCISLLGCLNASSLNFWQEDMIFLPTSFIPLKNQTRSISPKRPFLNPTLGKSWYGKVVAWSNPKQDAIKASNILNILKHVP